MREFTDGDLVVTLNYSTIYLQERQTLRAYMMDPDAFGYYRLTNSDGDIDAKFYSEKEDRSVFVDLSDFLRYRHANGQSTDLIFKAYSNEGLEVASVSVPSSSVRNGIDPEHYVLPPLNAQDYETFFYDTPPSMILGDFGFNNVVSINMLPDAPFGSAPRVVITKENGQVVTQYLNDGAIVLPASTISFYIEEQSAQELKDHPFRVKSISECDICACVEWQSITGIVKRATWKVSKRYAKPYNKVELMPDARTFRTLKGREEEAVIYLEDLTPYDVSYYADILQSSDVRLVFSDQNLADVTYNGRLREEYAVDVITDSAIPNAGTAELQKIEVTVKTKRYDAAYM